MKKIAALLLFCLACTGFAADYQFYFFYKEGVPQKAEMEKIFDSAVDSAKAQAKKIDIEDKSAKEMVEKYDLQHAPMPFVLVFAPNGAITGAFVPPFQKEELLQSIVSPTTAKTLKPLQEGKLVFVMIQNNKTKNNQEALQGVKEFQADSKYRDATEIIMLDPTDPNEVSFLEQLEIDPKTEEAVTIFFAPPGEVLGKYTGPTNKEELESTLENALTRCTGPECCPGGKCTPDK